MTAQYDSVHWNPHLIAARAKIFFIILVDGMFTTFIARPLPTFLMRSAKIERRLACNTQATPINSPAT
jgi:hypothetical protein